MKNIIIIGILMCVLTSCSDEGVKIGIVGSMSGRNSDLSVSGRRGAEIAVSQINNSGGINGKKIELISKDDEGNSKNISTINSFFEKNNINIVIGNYTSQMMSCCMDNIRKTNLLFISPTISSNEFDGKDDNIIRLINSNKNESVIIGKNMLENDVNNIAIIFDQNNKSYCETLINKMTNIFEDDTHKIILKYGYKNLDNDSSDIIDKIIQNKPDAILFISNSYDTAHLCQLVRLNNINTKKYATLWSNTPELFKKGGVAINDMKIISVIDFNCKKMDYDNFKNNYINLYNEEPSFSSIFTYESVQIIAKAISKVKSTDKNKLKAQIIKDTHIKGLQEEFQIDKYGDCNRGFFLSNIKDGHAWRITND